MDKVRKKQRRKQAQYLRQEPDADANFQEEPSVHVFIGNGGLKNGIPRELLEHLLGSPSGSKSSHKLDTVKSIYLPSGKDYAFATFTSKAIAAQAVSSLNGICIQEACCKDETLTRYLSPAVLNGPPVHLYLSFTDKIPSNIQSISRTTEEVKWDMDYPPGLILVHDFISAQEERELIKFFKITHEIGSTSQPDVLDDTETSDKCTTGTFHCEDLVTKEKVLHSSYTTPVTELTDSIAHAPKAALKNRYVMHYGYEFLYGANTVDPSHPLPGGLPGICKSLLDRMVKRGLVTEDGQPDQLTVNEYLPGAGM